jgi:RNA polymerase-binding transcription factor DksA
MKKSTQQKFKKPLEELRDFLKIELKNIAKRDIEDENNWNSVFPRLDSGNFNIEDASDEVEEYINRMPVENALELRLKAVNEALERIKRGAYGKCKNCEGDIPLKRLKVLPETEICLKCKTK